MTTRGGKRPGSGRKPGTSNSKSLEIAKKALTEGITPLEVMLCGMREYYDKWQSERDALLRMKYKELACESAKDAAPYIHPRLTSMSVGNENDKPFKQEITWLPVQG